MAGKPQNVFPKIVSLKEKLLPAVEGLSDTQIRSIICHCAYYKCGRKKELSEKEREVYDLLLRHKISPKTAYEWFRLMDVPDHIRQKIMRCEISMTEASARSYAWKRMITTRAGKQMMEDIRKIIGGLQWKNRNHTINSQY
jgi:hypothetical protein